jgi:methyl-accepting chemotaxis protein-1 (serine sensor receptor)
MPFGMGIQLDFLVGRGRPSWRGSPNNPTRNPPMFANLTVRTRLALLLTFVNLMLFAAAGYAWYAITRLNGHIEHTIKENNHVEAASNLARKAQVDFKVQVQEWKNTLIRGNDPALYDRHWKAFADRSGNVKKHLTGLNAEAKNIGLPGDIADKALAEHEELDRRYHAAIKSFDGNKESSADVVDALVRGIDRAANDNIDALVDRIQEHGDKLAAITSKEAATDKSALVIGLIVLAFCAALVSIIAGTLTILAITRRLQRATEVAREVAAGNLTADDRGRPQRRAGPAARLPAGDERFAHRHRRARAPGCRARDQRLGRDRRGQRGSLLAYRRAGLEP